MVNALEPRLRNDKKQRTQKEQAFPRKRESRKVLFKQLKHTR